MHIIHVHQSVQKLSFKICIKCACIHTEFMGDHPWLGKTTYGVVDGLGNQLWQQNLP